MGMDNNKPIVEGFLSIFEKGEADWLGAESLSKKSGAIISGKSTTESHPGTFLCSSVQE